MDPSDGNGKGVRSPRDGSKTPPRGLHTLVRRPQPQDCSKRFPKGQPRECLYGWLLPSSSFWLSSSPSLSQSPILLLLNLIFAALHPPLPLHPACPHPPPPLLTQGAPEIECKRVLHVPPPHPPFSAPVTTSSDLSSPSSLFARCVNKICASLLDCMLLRYPDQDNSHGDRLRMGCWRGMKHTTERTNIFIAQDVCGQMCHRTTGDECVTRRHVAYQHGEQFKTAGGNCVAICLGTNGPRCVRLAFLHQNYRIDAKIRLPSTIQRRASPCLGMLGRVRMLLCCLEVSLVF